MPSTFSLERNIDPKDDPKTAEIVDIFDSYLDQQAIDAPSTASQLTSLVEKHASESVDEMPWTPHLIYDEVLYRIRILSHDDPVQDKLVKLLGEIQQIESPKYGKDYWKSLAPFGMTVRELWNGQVGSEHTVQSWTSLNAFIARINAAGLLSFNYYPIWAIRSALEDFTFSERDKVTGKVMDGELNPEILDMHTSAACVWIFYCGETIWALSQQDGFEDTRATMGGPSWKGQNGYSVQRWKYWKERLREFAERDDLTMETRRMAEKAYSIMQEIGK